MRKVRVALFERAPLLISLACHIVGVLFLGLIAFERTSSTEVWIDIDLLSARSSPLRKRVAVVRPQLTGHAVANFSVASVDVDPTAPKASLDLGVTAVDLPSGFGVDADLLRAAEGRSTGIRTQTMVLDNLHEPTTTLRARRIEKSPVPITLPTTLLGDRPESIVVLLESMTTGSATPAMPSADLLAQIHRQIEQARRYPHWAREAHYEGDVRVSFELDRTGRLESASVIRSSGHRLLDEAALDAIRRAAPYPSLERDSLVLRLTVRFRLESTS